MQPTRAAGLLPVLMAAWGTAACRLSVEPGSTYNPPPVSQGIVAGVVRDSAGLAVPDAIVCAVASFDASGTPAIVAAEAVTNSDGSYLVPVNLAFRADVRAALTVAATPSVSSGLAPAYTPGLMVLLATTLPPAETTFVDIVVPAGSPYNGVLCVG